MDGWARVMLLSAGLAGCTVGNGNGETFAGPTAGPSAGTSIGTSAGSTAANAVATEGSGSSGATGTGSGLPQTTSSCEGAVGVEVLGAECNDGCQCASGECFKIAVGSACSECIVDAQCMSGGAAGTCSLDPNTDPPFARCSQGERGVMCQPGSGGCAEGLVCAQLVDTMGFVPDYFCSECQTSADCGNPNVCAPVLALGNAVGLGLGHLYCVAPGTLGNGSLCPVSADGQGDGSVCQSGICSVAYVGAIGVVDIGVCSSCDNKSDCAPGQICERAELNGDGAVAATCL